MLRGCSRDHNRKLVDLAEALLATGRLPNEDRILRQVLG